MTDHSTPTVSEAASFSAIIGGFAYSAKAGAGLGKILLAGCTTLIGGFAGGLAGFLVGSLATKVAGIFPKGEETMQHAARYMAIAGTFIGAYAGYQKGADWLGKSDKIIWGVEFSARDDFNNNANARTDAKTLVIQPEAVLQRKARPQAPAA